MLNTSDSSPNRGQEFYPDVYLQFETSWADVAELLHDAFLETQGNDAIFAIEMNPPILLTWRNLQRHAAIQLFATSFHMQMATAESVLTFDLIHEKIKWA